MVIAVVLPERDSFALRPRLKAFLPSAFQSSAKLRSNIQNTQMSRSAAAFIAGNKFIYIQVSRLSVWDSGNLVHTSEKILKIIRNLHTINQHSTVCFMSLIVFLQLNSPFEFLDPFSCEQCFGHLSCCSVPVVLFHTIWKHSSFFFCTWNLTVVFSKASELIVFNLELLLLLLKIVFGLILGACSLFRHAWHMPPYSINNCID